jgi:hypothetical protein
MIDVRLGVRQKGSLTLCLGWSGMVGPSTGEAPTAPVVQWVSGLRLGGSVG